MIPSFLVIGSSRHVIQLYMGLFLYSLSSGIVVPCLTTLASSFGPPEHKGVTLGIFRSIGSLARAFGPLFASAIFWRIGPTYCYIGGGVLFVLPLCAMFKLHRCLISNAKTQTNGNKSDVNDFITSEKIKSC